MFRCLVLLALLAVAAPLRAEDWYGRVTHVWDGDTLWVRPDDGGRPRKLRLHGIDAPELCQAHGVAARDALRRQALGQRVQVQTLREDDYGRALVRLQLHGQDPAAQLVRDGHAWSYRYRRHPGPYVREEGEARAARRGLFAADRPERPYDFRRRHGPC